MEIQQLVYFIEVVKQLSFRTAAKKLNISQPAITKQIQLLELELNTDLFDKNQRKHHKKVVLTDTGMYFFNEANKIIQNCRNAIEGVRKLENKKKTIKVGIYDLIPKYRVLEIIETLKNKLGDVELKILEFISPKDVEEAILKEEILIGISSFGQKDENLEYIELLKGNLQIWVNKYHPLAQNKYLTPRQLKNEKFIEIDNRLHTGITEMDKLLQKFGVSKQANTVQIVSSFEVVSGLIALDMGIGIAPSYYAPLNDKVVKIDLVIDESNHTLVYTSQLIVFKKSNNSSIINALVTNK
ncbi:MAG: LysR family transcriptional regulator [Spirosomataceae bacterium]